MPDLPHLLNLNGDCIRPLVRRSVFLSEDGGFWPLYLTRAGLGSNVSTCDGPPFMNRWMTRLAFALKCGLLGDSGLLPPATKGAAASSGCSCASRAARPSDPRPVPTRASISRRENRDMA